MWRLVLIVTLCALALDADEFRLALVVDDERCKMPATRTSGIKTFGVFLNIQTTLAVVAVDDGGAVMLLKLLLLMVPELLPRCAAVLRGGNACLEIDGAHVHNMNWILLFKWRVGNQASVHSNNLAEVRHGAYT
jgi:hypothetical protein